MGPAPGACREQSRTNTDDTAAYLPTAESSESFSCPHLPRVGTVQLPFDCVAHRQVLRMAGCGGQWRENGVVHPLPAFAAGSVADESLQFHRCPVAPAS